MCALQLEDVALSRIQAALLNLTTSVSAVLNMTQSLDGISAATQDIFDHTDLAVQSTVGTSGIKGS
jgi:hypothetical protein